MKKKELTLTHDNANHLNGSKAMSEQDTDRRHIAIIVILGFLSYARIFLVNTTFWDDNCWLLSVYNSNSLNDFLNAGGRDLRRIPASIFTYYLISLHKNTEIYFPFYHAINIISQTCTSAFIYLFVQRAFKNSHLAICAALVAILYPIDTTTPIFTTVAYRIGLLLSMISLYLSVAAIRERVHWRLIAGSLFCAALAQNVFVEGAIALEPARLLVIWHLLSGREKDTARLRKTFAVIAGLFLVITIPLVYYKLTYKPYGTYAGTYKPDPLFLLRWRMHRRAIFSLFFINWVYFSKYVMHHVLSAWSVLLGLAAALGGYLQFGRIFPKTQDAPSSEFPPDSFTRCFRENRFVFLLGLTFYIPPVIMYEYAGRVVFTGVESRHGALLVIGFALIWGGGLHAMFTFFQTRRFGLRISHVALSMFIGTGVFYHNVNHDLYLESQREQQKFWRAFTGRFPTLPERASFVFDVKSPDLLYDAPFGSTFGIEYFLNLLYARSASPDGLKNYLAGPGWNLRQGTDLSKFFSQRHPGSGRPYSGNEPVIVVRYENGELLVNREILAKYADVPYRWLLDRAIPALPAAHGGYPLRQKLPGFYQ